MCVEESTQHRESLRPFLALLLLVMAIQSLAVYPSDYLTTDDRLIVSFGREAEGLASLFERQTAGTPAIRPVSLGLARIEHHVLGDTAAPRLLFHVLLHALAALLVALALQGMGSGNRLAGLTMLLFAAQPLAAEPLAWFHGGHTTLPMATLALAAVTGHIRRWPRPLTALLFGLALLTRENAIMVVAITFWISWIRCRGLRSVLADMWPFIVVAAVFVSIRAWQLITVLTSDETAYLPFGGNPLLSVLYLSFHLSIPVQPAIDGAWFWLGGAALLTGWAALAARQNLRIALLWMGLWCLPFLPLYATNDPLFSVDQSNYDRRWYYLYIPSIGISYLVACALVSRRRLAWLVIPAVLALQIQNATWWSGLGESARNSRTQIEALLGTERPLLFLFESTDDALSEIIEHQLVDTPRLLPESPQVPVFRKKPGEDQVVRASRDPFDYPLWVPVPRPDLLPQDILAVSWDPHTAQFQTRPPPHFPAPSPTAPP